MVEINRPYPTVEAEQALRPLLCNFTYRPGWTFDIFQGTLVIKATVIDADNPRHKIPLQFGIGLPTLPRPNFRWERWLFDQIMEVERHEAQEFFQLNGVKVFDPHG